MKAVYAGSFDPVTNGHLWVITTAAVLFDDLIVAVGVNSEKKTMFSLQEREYMIKSTLVHQHHLRNVQTSIFRDVYLVNFAKSIGAQFVIRGIRNTIDYENEKMWGNVNCEICPDVTTVYLMPPKNLSETSSSLIKGLIGPEGWEEEVQKHVPVSVFEKLKEKINVK
jgi:pantetheine-phosphate adenylyltransferase